MVIAFHLKDLPSNYIGVVLSRWLRSLRNLNEEFKQMDATSYFYRHELFLKEQLLPRPDVIIKFLVLKNDPDIVFGWCCYENDTLHYIHIQEPYRNQRRSYDLLPKNIRRFTHRTKHWNMKFWKRNMKHLIYDPYL